MGGAEGRFPSTRLTLLEAAADGLANEAMERVIALYWKPVYRFIRIKFRKNNEDAKDLTQSFFATALENELLARFDPGKASFRTYLRMTVERFAAREWESAGRQKRGGGMVFEAVEEQAALAESPEEAFEREWRRELFGLSVEDLRALCERCGKEVQFRIFEAYDLADGDRPSYAELGQRYGVAESAVTNYLAWARRTLRGLVTERMRGVTSGDRELREELRRVW